METKKTIASIEMTPPLSIQTRAPSRHLRAINTNVTPGAVIVGGQCELPDSFNFNEKAANATVCVDMTKHPPKDTGKEKEKEIPFSPCITSIPNPAPEPALGSGKALTPLTKSNYNLSAENIAFVPQTSPRESSPGKAMRSRSMIARLKNASSRNRSNITRL